MPKWKTSLTLVDIDPRTGKDSSGSVHTQPGISGIGDKVTQEGTPVVRGTPVDEPYVVADSYTHKLAILVLHVILGKGSVWFPTSDRAAPSLEVAVLATVGGPIRPYFRPYFPSFIKWDHWQYGVVPVIQDTANQKAASRIKTLLNRKDYKEVLKLLEGELLKSFRDNGFLPAVGNTGTGESSTSVESSATAASLPRKVQAGSAPTTDE